ncbi:MAG: hypothetical protein IPN90_08250 [Elusimicrobia bacterium]|nr:hypothetical protein [Elusimicrobiota bacterium]
MLKIVLAAYARRMISSREIAFACEQNVIFMALSARSARTLRPSRSSSVKWAL